MTTYLCGTAMTVRTDAHLPRAKTVRQPKTKPSPEMPTSLWRHTQKKDASETGHHRTAGWVFSRRAAAVLFRLAAACWIVGAVTPTQGQQSFQTWNPDCFPLPGHAVFDRGHQQVTAVARMPSTLDLFVIGNDGHIWTTAWSEAKGWAPDCFPLPGRAIFDREHQHISAISRAPGNLDLFVIGNDGHIWSTAWNEHAGWAPDWFPLPGKAVFDRDHQQFAVTARTPQNLDLFSIGSDDGHIWSTFWGPRHPMTLDASVDETSITVPSQVGLHIAATDGIVSQTEWKATKNGAVLPGVGDNVPAGIALDRILAVSQPGSYGITVNRTGWTGPSGPTTLSRHFDITAGLSTPPPVGSTTPPASAAPQITVDYSGTIQDAKFHVVGSGFPKNLQTLPNTNRGVAIRFVDANSLIETRREYTGTNGEGKIDHVIEGDLSSLTRNALGIATAAISATDGTKDPNDSTGFLWSNTVRIDFR